MAEGEGLKAIKHKGSEAGKGRGYLLCLTTISNTDLYIVPLAMHLAVARRIF